MKMESEVKSALIGNLMVISSAVIVTIGIIVASTVNFFAGILIALGGAIPWGWACFAKPKLYE
jgi:hypothetical protein